MKRREWNEEQLEQLLQQLPSIKDKRTATNIRQNIQLKQKTRKNSKTWILPSIATVAALLIFVLISPYLFQGFTSSNEESAMDMATTSSEESAQLEKSSLAENNMQEATIIEEEKTESLADKQLKEETATFVTNKKDSEKILTIGLTDGMAQNILPVSVETEENKIKLQQLKAFVPENFADQLGPVSFELISTDFHTKENPAEIFVEYKGEPSVTSSTGEMRYKESIQETFRWLGIKEAKLFTNEDEGIEFGNTGLQTELEIPQIRNKAYLVYQYDEHTSKLLVPTPEAYSTIEDAVEIMKQGLSNYNLTPSIPKNIKEIEVHANGNQLDIEFKEGTVIENNEESIIMLESLLLTAKDFGFKTVQFKGIVEKEIGLMNLTKPIDVPFSPNPIK